MLSDFDMCFKADVVPTLQNRLHRISNKFWLRRNRCYCFGSVANLRDSEKMEAEFMAEPVTAFSKSCVGTHEYLAPELVSGNGRGNGVDWWAFGILIHELLYGMTPFKGQSKESTLRKIASSRLLKIQVEEKEEKGVAEARDLIEKLLVKDPRRRLGCARGATDIKRHPFFDGVKWPLIRSYILLDARGLVRRTTSHVSSTVNVSHKNQRRWWKIISFLRK
ncbi:serine/threonine-protein kinase WAG1-like [Mangifera indica]|uniref:serine/threonine-protein kinase WAG1-like n=1 Tax=Mangifera indica TaxID=29780 RepID=UPI001CFB09A3|nr:serine/threonine-protein kinase WAG1-like [Mangifera indica]